MASLASLNPFMNLSDTDSGVNNKRTGNNSKAYNSSDATMLQNGTRRIDQMAMEDDTFGGMSTQHVHIDQLSDFDPWRSQKTKVVEHEDFTLDSVPARQNNSQPTGENGYEGRKVFTKHHSSEDDWLKLSMLAHRGTLNEAEKMVSEGVGYGTNTRNFVFDLFRDMQK